MERMTAVKVRMRDITGGSWVKNEGMVPSYVITPYGEQVSRSRVIGTVVSKFIAEDGNFASITVDDSTDTMRLKTFKTVKPLDRIEVGDVVDVVGKLREFNGEVYMIPEVVRKADISWELLRKLEVLKRMERFGIQGGKNAGVVKRDAGLREEILKVIGSKKEGVEFGEVVRNVKAPEDRIEEEINSLLAEGICYESRPGMIRKI